jgi:hypothetical protein
VIFNPMLGLTTESDSERAALAFVQTFLPHEPPFTSGHVRHLFIAQLAALLDKRVADVVADMSKDKVPA